jgi:DNA-binding beta-propeller fold protein YncE
MRPAYILFVAAVVLPAQTDDTPVRAVTDPGVVTTRQAIAPAGVQTVFTGRVYGVAFGATSSEVWVLNASAIYRLDWQSNKILSTVTLGGNPGLQSLRYDEPSKRVLFAQTARGAGVQLVSTDGERRQVLAPELGSSLSSALAVAAKPGSSGKRLAVVPLTANNKLAVVDVEGSALLGHAPTGIAPFGAVISNDGTAAYVTNWGGRIPGKGDRTAPTGAAATADRVVIDERGVAATGTVTRIDLATLAITHTIPVGLHPTALIWDEPRNRLYVANTNSDSIAVIDTTKQALVRSIDLQPFERKVKGIAPTALALEPNGRKLYVGCGGINAVVVVDTQSSQIDGMVPTAWYPNAVALSADGRKLAVTALLGVGSGWRDEPKKRFVHAYRGTVSVLDVPTGPQLASYTTAVAESNRLQLADRSVPEPAARASAQPIPIPARSGEPSTIEHVVFIIKENRTYDQVFGDLPQGNGDPSLVMFGRDITPNQHRLAEEFVLLDNFYATGGNSADGHQWVTQASETSYCLWPGYAGRSYPYDGNDPIAYASGGFLWDYVLARKKTVRVYGEFVPALRVPVDRHQLLERWQKGESFSKEWNVSSPIPRLNENLAKHFPSYTTAIPDVVRASIFLEDIQRFEKEGSMPNLILLQLPSNHTNGARPGSSTPQAMVADNDLALGQIVQALSHSRFWPKMAIFVTEDDAQNGVDHVDGHRTTSLVISPYARRKHLDSTFYSTQSMVKTIELILGLPTMSLFDLIANDMRASFTETPDLTPFKAETPKQSLLVRNPPASALRGPAREAALASMKMRFDVPDAAPTEKLNRITWGLVRGWKTPYPQVRNAVFAPLSLDIDDDDREEAER